MLGELGKRRGSRKKKFLFEKKCSFHAKIPIFLFFFRLLFFGFSSFLLCLTVSLSSLTILFLHFSPCSSLLFVSSFRIMSSNAKVGTTWTKEIDDDGEFRRQPTAFHDQMDESSAFQPEDGRYHLYVAWACPWANRTLLARALFGLEDVISVSFVHHLLDERGWHFEDEFKDDLYESSLLRDVYSRSVKSYYEHRVTVPVLWDKKTETIVNNESSEIIRILHRRFRPFFTRNQTLDLYPQDQQKTIDEMNDFVYPKLNNGVYRAGFARKQGAYEKGVTDVFEALDKMEDILSRQAWLVGDAFTEADLRAFVTLVRFDSVYHTHFKCNRRSLSSYPHLWAYTRHIYQLPGVAVTIDMEDTKKHYFRSHTSINPLQIVPIGPGFEKVMSEPHGRKACMNVKE